MDFFDLHCDTLTGCMDSNESIFKNTKQNSVFDLMKFDRANQLFAVFTDDPFVDDAYNYVNRAIDFFYAELEKYAENIALFPNNKDKVGAILTIEGGEPIESLEALDEFYNKGVRLVTLTWNRVNKLGSGMTSGSEDGLTDFGKAVVREMNRQDMIIDVSHLNINGFKDVANLSEKPFAATHSNCRSICPHPRNLHDWQIKEIKNSGGIIGLNLYPPFLSENPTANMDDILRHTDHFLELGCEDILCLGCDFDGIDKSPEDINGTKDMPIVYKAFKENFGGIADKIFYENADRFFRN
ncbi:MAG: membrane dipeptidase [Firmicutes bacterium]|nr:membrane dipeptidase [Bacillota bacterium]